jgi:aspartyl-tRNA(Asn)/glutamyl-tRNA(Gln) amidotransferase subunit C
MELDEALIMHVAKVSRLHLTKKEIDEFLPELQEVITYFSQLSRIDTENIEPMVNPVMLRNSLRKDEANSSLSQEDSLRNTQHKKEGYFLGPKIL